MSPTLPVVGVIPYPLVIAAIVWSLFGTAASGRGRHQAAGAGIQATSASRRPSARNWSSARTIRRAPPPPTLAELFRNVRKNYFTLYLHYVYFDVVRYLYLQADAIFATLLLVPTVAVGKITLGIFQQIVSAFTQVATSFQYLVNSWPTIVELISIYKRLRAFEATLEGAPLPEHRPALFGRARGWSRTKA